MKDRYSAPTINELLAEHDLMYHQHGQQPRGELIAFRSPLDNSGIYNPTAPFTHRGNVYSAGRVDLPGGEHAVTQFFKPNGTPGEWHHDPSMPNLLLQDPFTGTIGDRRYFGGVRTYTKFGTDEIHGWDTVIRVVDDPVELHDNKPPDIVSPFMTKGMRPDVSDGELVGMIIRPIDHRYPRGKVGYLALKANIEKITPYNLARAPIIEGFINHKAGEWGGVTGLDDIDKKLVLANMHLARFARTGAKDYYGGLMLMQRRANRLTVVAQKITACRRCFPGAPAKKVPGHSEDYVENVTYPTGMTRNGKVEQWSGLSDYSVGKLDVSYDFDRLLEMAA